MALLSANQSWFEIKIQGGPDFGVYSLKGRECLNEPYEFELELVSRDSALDLVDLLGRQALLSISDHGGHGLERLVNGSIRQAEQLHTANAFTHYRIFLVPRLWYLGENQDHRIFQHKNVPDIIETILKEQGFPSENFTFKLKESYETREYCVQYAESDLYFISRLCEEEGIYFYFEHETDKHVLCFSDSAGGPWIKGGSNGAVRFFSGSGQSAEDAVVNHLNLRQKINSDKASYREWNFIKPPLNLSVSEGEPDQKKAPAPGGLNLDTYQFPHLYQLTEPGNRYADIQLKRQLSFSRWVDGESGVARLLPGFGFTLFDHPRSDVNTGWWLCEVNHFGEQPQVLEHESPDRGFMYQSRFTAIPVETRYVPAFVHKKKRVDGLQSAIVTGPDGEEVYVDPYGRIKVHFHWDRLGPITEKSTCWIRVADGWAGQNFGFMQAPRIGQEVIVEFMEGDPDRPVITGRVYNSEKMPPWKLPSQKVLSGIQSREFKGGQRNQLLFDDTFGQIQAQISSDHNLSQLNLGYLTRVNHVEGRKDFRGEGFELRTDGWGAVRSAKGIYIGTDPREHARAHHKDIGEPVGQLQAAEGQQSSFGELAAMHNAHDTEDNKIVTEALKAQNKELQGSGEAHGEMTAPHLLLSSPAGVAVATPKSTHIRTGEHMALTAAGHFSFTSAKSFLGVALERVSLFAHKLGMKLIAASGKVEIQAQSDDLDIIADKVMRLISAQDKVQLASPKEVEILAAGSYIKMTKGGIEMGTSGSFTVHAAKHSFVGPKTVTPEGCPLPSGLVNDEQFVVQDLEGKPFRGMPFKIVEGGNESAVLAEGVTSIDGSAPRVYTVPEKNLKVVWDVEKYLETLEDIVISDDES